MPAVSFDIATFRARYPEFTGVGDPLIVACFGETALYLRNDDQSIVTDLTQRAVLLNMLTAHIVQIGQNELVGRISQATEGSVSVTAEMAPAVGSSAWYAQTKYGAAYWQATAQYRTFRHVAGRSRPQYGFPPR